MNLKKYNLIFSLLNKLLVNYTPEAIKYLKDNKTAVLDSIAAELLKSGGTSLVNALNEMKKLHLAGLDRRNTT
jgi:uncharacterized protein with GYD domain